MNIAKTSEDFLEGRVELEEIVFVVEKEKVRSPIAKDLASLLTECTDFAPIIDSYFDELNKAYVFKIVGDTFYLDIRDLRYIVGSSLEHKKWVKQLSGRQLNIICESIYSLDELPF